MGNNFVNSSTLRCRFAQQISVAPFLSDTRVACVAPAHAFGNISVEVSNNLLDFSWQYLQFTYQQTVSVTSVWPEAGPNSGATVVTVSGTNFVVPAFCKFGTTMSPGATVQSSTLLRCVSPAHVNGPVALEMSNNNQDFSTSVRVYTFYEPPVVLELVPANGPLMGFTVVTVNGHYFTDTHPTHCKFGTHAPVPSTWVTATRIRCTAPAETAATTMAVEVGNNNQDFSSSGVVYTYQRNATVLSTNPTTGTPCMVFVDFNIRYSHIADGGLLVTVFGSEFVSSSLLACLFDSRYASVSSVIWLSNITGTKVYPLQRLSQARRSRVARHRMRPPMCPWRSATIDRTTLSTRCSSAMNVRCSVTL